MRTSCRASPTTCVIYGAERRERYRFALQHTTPTSFASEAAVISTSTLPASILAERCSISIARLGAEACILGTSPDRFPPLQAANIATDWKTRCFMSKPLALQAFSAPKNSRPVLVFFGLKPWWKLSCVQCWSSAIGSLSSPPKT